MAGGNETSALHAGTSPFGSKLPVTHKAFDGVKPVSYKRLNIAGILVIVYGLQELTSRNDVACCWLLHGRGDTQDSMSFVAAAFINAWTSQKKPGQRGLICVSIDQRNHGSRMVDAKANDSWSAGNENHAPDMFTLYSGSAQDVSMLITHLPAYLSFRPAMHICAGISLGGHATWQCMFSDSRVTAGIIVVGCPDYVRLMTDRAIRGKLASCMSTDPPGRAFLGSRDFPRSLVEAVEQFDPAGILLGELDTVTGDDHKHPPSSSEIARLKPIMHKRLAGKSFLLLSGGKDKLVPYKHSEPFLTWFKHAIDKKSGWYPDSRITLDDVIDDNAGHEFSSAMRSTAETWLCDLLSNEKTRDERDSKM